MKRSKFTDEQILAIVREGEAGRKVADLVRTHAITEQTYYRWHKEYGGMELDQARRLKDFVKETARLKRLLAEAELDKPILREAASGKHRARRSGARRSSTSGACSASTAAPSAGRAG